MKFWFLQGNVVDKDINKIRQYLNSARDKVKKKQVKGVVVVAVVRQFVIILPICNKSAQYTLFLVINTSIRNARLKLAKIQTKAKQTKANQTKANQTPS